MIWLTSLPTAVLIIGGLAAALLFVIGARLAVRALIPVTQRDSAHTIAAPLMTALGGLWQGRTAAEGDDAATAHALANLENVVRTQVARPGLATPTSSELLTSLDALTNDRRARLAAASRELPVLYVAVLVVAGAALITNATLLTLRSGWRAALPVGGLAVVIGLSVALLFALSAPWRGAVTVSGHPIDAVMRDLNAGYFQR